MQKVKIKYSFCLRLQTSKKNPVKNIFTWNIFSFVFVSIWMLLTPFKPPQFVLVVPHSTQNHKAYTTNSLHKNGICTLPAFSEVPCLYDQTPYLLTIHWGSSSQWQIPRNEGSTILAFLILYIMDSCGA